jgi:hypothetical protein
MLEPDEQIALLGLAAFVLAFGLALSNLFVNAAAALH